MIEKIIEFSIRNRFLVFLGTLFLVGYGIYSVLNTPVDAIPDLSENQVIVFTDWMGRSPKEIEDQVTYPLSVNLQGLAGVKAVRSSSEFNFSMINIIFEDNIGFYFARERVLERLTLATTFLPEGVVPYLAPDATALGQIFWYTVEGEGQDLGKLRATQDWYVRYQLNSVPGVAQVASVGGSPIEYQIDVDPDKLRALGVTLGEMVSAVARSNSSVGGRVVQKANAEYLVRGVGWITSLKDIENIVVKSDPRLGTPITVGNLATVGKGPQFRRSVLEKNGNEAVGGVCMMRYGENPLAVTKRIKQKIVELQPGLPAGVRIVPFYDRTQLIEGGIHTLTETLLHESIIASIAILLILMHFRSAFVICITLPLAALFSFIMMRVFGIASNIMSLAGIAIAIGILVDQAIVMVENATHHLKAHFGDAKVIGDTRELVIPACRTVGRPIFFSVLIILLSFIPVFALTGQEGKTFHPLAFTKSFAMIGVAILSITLVPAMIPTFVRGRLRREDENWIVRGLIEIYKPVLQWALPRRNLVMWSFAVLLILGSGIFPLDALFGIRWKWAFLGVFAVVTLATVYFTVGALWQSLAFASLLVLALWAYGFEKIGRDYMPPLDEGSILDMPVTVPRASVTEVSDDIKARDSVLRSFPEVEQVVGKAGRAETATDPAPLEMVETVVNLRPKKLWPKRKLKYSDARQQTEAVLAALVDAGLVQRSGATEQKELIESAAMNASNRLDTLLRSFVLDEQRQAEPEIGKQLTGDFIDQLVGYWSSMGELRRELTPAERDTLIGDLNVQVGERLITGSAQTDVTQMIQKIAEQLAAWKVVELKPQLLTLRRNWLGASVAAVWEVMGGEPDTLFTLMFQKAEQHRDDVLLRRARPLDHRVFDIAVGAFDWYCIEELAGAAVRDERWRGPPLKTAALTNPRTLAGGDLGVQLRDLRAAVDVPFARGLLLWHKDKDDLVKEMDSALQMPGWGNIWTQPIINRINMLATGVRTDIGVKVFGKNLDEIQRVSNEIAGVLKTIRGAVDVEPDQSTGKGYLEITIDREKAARYGINVGDIQDIIEVALGGKPITTTVEGQQRFPVRLRYARAFRQDEQQVKNVLINAGSPTAPVNDKGGTGAKSAMGAAAGSSMTKTIAAPLQIPLSSVADVKIVEGPAMIKSENGALRSYVQLNVRNRDSVGFVEEAQQAVAQKVKLPQGMHLEWSGEFEAKLRSDKTMRVVWPAVMLLIFIILYLTYNDFADAVLMMMAVPEALVGGVFFLWLTGFHYSVAVQVGFIACFGMATETGIIMLVYLREAIDRHGGLENIASLDELRRIVVEGAVHRLRPKLLTEGVAIVALAPMLWTKGVGHEVISAMAAPVLGGLLVSDEVVDLFIPVRFYWVRRARWLKLHADQSPATTGGANAN